MSENQNISKYIIEKKTLYDHLIIYLEDDNSNDKGFAKLIKILDNDFKSTEDLWHLLKLLVSISNNHYRGLNLIQKIEKILQYLKKQIIQTFTNIEIFNIFKCNKKILLLCFQKQILKIDGNVAKGIIYESKLKGKHYIIYFYPELKSFYGEEKFKKVEQRMIEIDPYIFFDFDEKRNCGENDSYICSLIRQDLVQEFITYINQKCISLFSYINPSFFETNSFLINKKISLIEYAAFHGSIQIFKYLVLNDVDLMPSIWYYAIHSQSDELIYYIESIDINPPYDKCNKESIKCHHNNIANYINENYECNLNNDEYIASDIISSKILKHHNYSFFTYDFIMNVDSAYLTLNDYYELNHFLLEQKPEKVAYLDNNENYFRNNNGLYKFSILPPIETIGDNAFHSCSRLTRISIPYSMISIGASAFCDCNSLKKVFIPSSVTSIGYNAFGNCISLKKVTFEFPSSLTILGIKVFEGCKSLKRIIIPSSVTSIEDNCFNNCTSLQEISVSFSIISIRKNSFSNCRSLTKIRFPNVKYIGESAFNKCSFISAVKISHSLQSNYINYINACIQNSIIDNRAFYNSSLITHIDIPFSITKIGKQAFSECKSLTHVSIPPSITSIKYAAFSKCISLIEVSMPSSLTEIGKNVFEGCTSLQKVLISPNVKIIQNQCFSKCKSLKKILIPANITEIESYAFYMCKSLEEIIFESPCSLTTIGKGAFHKCRLITKFVIPSSVKLINDAFPKNCSLIERIEITSNCALIEESIFKSCSNLTRKLIYSSKNKTSKESINKCICTLKYNKNPFFIEIIDDITNDGLSYIKMNFPSNVTSIYYNEFCWLSSFTHVTIPNSVTKIEAKAFYECTSLAHITIPNSVTLIGISAFSQCTSLSQVVFEYPSSVKTIGDYAFYACESLEQISIPSSVISIGSSTFSDCINLGIVSFDLPSVIHSIADYAFYKCLSLEQISIPSPISFIGSNAFNECPNLIEMPIGTSLKKSGYNSFQSTTIIQRI